jgi:hypothetical protein
VQQLGGLEDDLCTLRIGCVLPTCEAGRSRSQFLLELFVRNFVEGFDQFIAAVAGMSACGDTDPDSTAGSPAASESTHESSTART